MRYFILDTIKLAALLLPGVGMNEKTKRNKTPTDYREKIVDVAIECIQKYGVAKTTVEDVTKMANLGRMTVYRTFRTRADLLDAVAMRRLREMEEWLKPVFESYKSFDDVIVKGSIKVVEFARKDPIFFSVIEEASDRGVEYLIVNPKSPVRLVTLELFGEALTAAKRRGEMRKDLAVIDVAAWLRAVHLILLLRDDLTVRGQSNLLKQFVLPALLAK